MCRAGCGCCVEVVGCLGVWYVSSLCPEACARRCTCVVVEDWCVGSGFRQQRNVRCPVLGNGYYKATVDATLEALGTREGCR